MFRFEEAQLLSITDASHAADFDVSQSGQRMGLRSQSGRILAMAGPSFWADGGGDIALLSWKSTVLRRVCRSTLQAERLSMLAGYEEAEHARMVIHGLGHEHKANDPNWEIKAKDAAQILKLTDCRSLSDHLRQCGLGEVNDKRLAIDLSGMRQMIWRHAGQDVGDPLFEDKPPEQATTKVEWIATTDMLSDALTKRMDSTDLREVMAGSAFKLRHTFMPQVKMGVKTEVPPGDMQSHDLS